MSKIDWYKEDRVRMLNFILGDLEEFRQSIVIAGDLFEEGGNAELAAKYRDINEGYRRAMARVAGLKDRL